MRLILLFFLTLVQGITQGFSIVLLIPFLQLLEGDPATDEGLEALSQAPGDSEKWQGPYLEQDSLQDPWGRPYQYQFPGQYSEDKPDIWSLGPDGEDGSEDDVGNWIEG